MSEREEKIIEAAVQLFSRYGVKRTSMNDIAAEAGIARQTLYNAFSNKDEVLQATIRLFSDRACAQIDAGLEATDDLGERVDVIFKHMAIEPFDLLNASPNAEDIVAGFNSSSQQEIAAAAERNRVIIAQVMEPYKGAIERSGLTLDQFADFVQRSASGAKYNASNRRHLLRLLAALKVAALKVADTA
ncbi:MAG: TetR/AcrR family transcriptional regulator [Geminicoccaceae bacterium]